MYPRIRSKLSVIIKKKKKKRKKRKKKNNMLKLKESAKFYKSRLYTIRLLTF